MSEEYKPVVQHIESVAGVKPEQVGEIQSEIEQLMLLSDEDYRKEERKLLRKVRRLLLSCGVRYPDLFYALHSDRLYPAADPLYSADPQLFGPQCARERSSARPREGLGNEGHRLQHRHFSSLRR